MAYHQWLNGTSAPHCSAVKMGSDVFQMTDASFKFVAGFDSDTYNMSFQKAGPETHSSGQAARSNLKSPKLEFESEKSLDKYAAASSMGGHGHPIIPLSNIEQTKVAEVEQQYFVEKASFNEMTYQQGMSKRSGTQWSEGLTETFLPTPPNSRDQTPVRPPPSLAATHPNNYRQHTSESSMPPPSSLPKRPGKRVPRPAAIRLSAGTRPSSDLPLGEAPWRMYNDPMWQTSSDPHFWSINRTILKSDGNAEVGNVVSPTWMIGLPLGGMTEMAVCYPYDE